MATLTKVQIGRACAPALLVVLLTALPDIGRAETLAQTIGLELALIDAIGLKLVIDSDCPANEIDTAIVARQKLAALKIPVDSDDDSLFLIKILASCLYLSDPVMAYAGDLELHMPVVLPSSLAWGGASDLSSAARMPIWTAKRFGSLGSPPKSLQTRALFGEIERMIDDFGEMWATSRAYRKKLEELSKQRQSESKP